MKGFLRFAARDAGLAALTASAWWLERRTHQRGGPGHAFSGAAAGVLTAVMGFAAHEWGHLIGTVAAGGVAHPPERLSSPFLFSFDVERSDRRAFLAMSYGGYAGTAIAIATIVALAPRDRLSGRIALAAAVLGGAVTAALEVPTTLRVARGGAFPSGGVYAGEPSRNASVASE